MSSNRKTQIVAQAGKQELFISRVFNAPPEVVFRAFSTPDLLEQFFAPAGTTVKFDVADFRSGGKYRYTQCDANGNALAAFSGVIHEVTSPERIIQTQEMEGLPQAGHVVLEAMHFERISDNQTKLTIHDVCMSVADRDAIIESGMASGLTAIFDQLDEVLNGI
ncbi:activator of HSP90 ATPase 1 family protein [Fibrisoma limi BUZ 3]|uniref:Activator of HSP90 ATPase 1 family protein n=1 Tax=Fibrisoma limi BUZ 3 TaxID=1185876 RepID=I2GMD6_9BACT|nr:SRPBCC family protein [Fibrisoma limi]CCH55063.1 activator of HSP90 ATPase 1 family protein [Fibrisoma limi BUZ 3]